VTLLIILEEECINHVDICWRETKVVKELNIGLHECHIVTSVEMDCKISFIKIVA
jgi:hypothetical protein